MRLAPPVAVLAATLVVVACSSSSSGTPSASSPLDAGGPDVSAKEPSDDAGSAPDGAPDATPDDAASTAPTCADKAKQVDCVSCCSTLHEAGAITYIAAIASCMCVPANCQTECTSTLCNTDPREPDGPCQQCLKAKDASCTDDLTKACSQDPDCIAFNTCIRGAGCNTKP